MMQQSEESFTKVMKNLEKKKQKLNELLTGEERLKVIFIKSHTKSFFSYLADLLKVESVFLTAQNSVHPLPNSIRCVK